MAAATTRLHRSDLLPLRLRLLRIRTTHSDTAKTAKSTQKAALAPGCWNGGTVPV